PVGGEVHDALVIAPPVFANLPTASFVFGEEKAKTIPVRVSSFTAAVRGAVRLDVPRGWRVTPASAPLELKAANDEMTAQFTVTPPAQAGEGTLRAVVSTDGHDYSFAREQIAYPHIGTHILMPAAEAKIVRADIK